MRQKRKQKVTQPANATRTVRFADVDLDEEDDGLLASHERDEHQEENEDAEAEEDDEDEDEEGEGFIDILDVLDGRAKPYLASESEGDDSEDQEPNGATSRTGMEDGQSAKHIHDDGQEESEERQNEQHRETSAGRDIDISDAESDVALVGLNQFILGLDSGSATATKRRTSDDSDEADRPRKRRLVAERSEAGYENEFGGRISSMA